MPASRYDAFDAALRRHADDAAAMFDYSAICHDRFDYRYALRVVYAAIRAETAAPTQQRYMLIRV